MSIFKARDCYVGSGINYARPFGCKSNWPFPLSIAARWQLGRRDAANDTAAGALFFHHDLRQDPVFHCINMADDADGAALILDRFQTFHGQVEATGVQGAIIMRARLMSA